MEASKQIFTIDMEDWFQPYYGSNLAPTEKWDNLHHHMPVMVEKTLGLLEKNQTKATFFCVGWIAKKHSRLLRTIHEAGHEIASHSYWHQPITSFEGSKLRAEIFDSKRELEDSIGTKVRGFRAPGFLMPKNQGEFFELLKEAGYEYDSSELRAHVRPYRKQNGVIEVPVNALNFGGKKFPTGGGVFFRILPFFVFKAWTKWSGTKLLNFYTHTWELEPDSPRFDLKGLKNWIQYARVHSVQAKVSKLTKKYRFTTIESFLQENKVE